MSRSCLVCSEVSGEVPVPGGHLHADEYLVVFHSPVIEPATDVYLGYLFVSPRRHAPGFADLADDEAAAVGIALARWSRALEAMGAEHVYVVRAGHVWPHLHVHLVPRWPGTPADISWVHVDDWSGARRVDIAGAAEAAQTLRALDARLRGAGT